tara:strand:- start:801 stop:3320 length:2520 start_codon:yes stop_codon:yes gene_type:complete
MGATYTRQSTFADGDTINAADSNDEFDQLVAFAASSTGHTHDGTTGEGGPISKLLSNAITIGTGVDTDIVITFDANTSDGVITWKEDEDYFEFSDDLLIASTEKLQFRDTAIYINSSTDGQLDLVADTEIQLAATTIDINGNVDISGTLTIGSAGISEAELEILDGATVTTAELNIMDGDTSASATTVVDADRVVFNDAGTMKQVAVTDLAAYFDDEITAMPNLVTTAATTVGALNSGSITSGFGAIDTGSSTITTTGLISGGSLDIDDVLINGATIGHTDDTDLITLSNGIVTIAGELDAVSLDISGDADIDGTLEADAITVDGTALSTVIAGTTVTNATNATNAVHVSVADNESTDEENLITFIEDASATGNVGLESDGNFSYNPSTGTVTATIFKGNIDAVDGDFDGTLEADAITVGGTALATVIAGTTVTDATNSAHVLVTDNESTDEENLITFVEGATSTTGNVGLEMDGNFAYNPSTGTVSATIFKGNIDAVDGDFDGTLEADAITVGGTALATVIAGTTVTNATNSAHVLVTDNESTDEENLIAFVEGATSSTGNVGLEMDGNLSYNPSTGTVTATVFKGNIDAVDGDFDGTLEADAITVGGVTLAEVISDTTGAMFSSNTETGVTVTYQDADNTIDVAIAAAQTTITSLLATDIKIGEDDETKIDFETANEIHFYAANVEQVYLGDNIFGPQSDSDVDLGSDGVRWKDAYVDSATVTGDVVVGDDITVAGRASGHVTTDNDGSFDLAVGNDFKCTTAGGLTLTFTNPTAGQSGNVMFINGSNHAIAAHASVAVSAATLTAISATGTYHLAYYCSADSGNNTILVSASAALT